MLQIGLIIIWCITCFVGEVWGNPPPHCWANTWAVFLYLFLLPWSWRDSGVQNFHLILYIMFINIFEELLYIKNTCPFCHYLVHLLLVTSPPAVLKVYMNAAGKNLSYGLIIGLCHLGLAWKGGQGYFSNQDTFSFTKFNSMLWLASYFLHTFLRDIRFL